MEAFKRTLRVVLLEIPKENSVWSARMYSKRSDHVRLSSNITLINSNSQYNPDKLALDVYNNDIKNNKDNSLKKAHIDPTKKPIVLLYGWLMSQDKFLKKFSDIYNDHGFDVLRVRVKVGEVLWPQSVKYTVKNLKNFIFSNLDRPYLVHGFSVGGFVHTELVQTLLKSQNEESRRAMGQIKGQIFDSVVDMHGVAEGVSMSLYIDDPLRRSLTCWAIQTYVNLTRKQVFDKYAQASRIFHSNPLLVPSLMFYSKADTIGAHGPIEAAINQWRNKGVPVTQRCWESTDHVGHYRADPEEYTHLLNTFLTSLGFIKAREVKVEREVRVAREVKVEREVRVEHEVRLEREGVKNPCDAGLRDTDANSPNRFKTDIKKVCEDGGEGKPIEVMSEVGESEEEKRKSAGRMRKKITVANEQA